VPRAFAYSAALSGVTKRFELAGTTRSIGTAIAAASATRGPPGRLLRLLRGRREQIVHGVTEDVVATDFSMRRARGSVVLRNLSKCFEDALEHPREQSRIFQVANQRMRYSSGIRAVAEDQGRLAAEASLHWYRSNLLHQVLRLILVFQLRRVDIVKIVVASFYPVVLILILRRLRRDHAKAVFIGDRNCTTVFFSSRFIV
jgi:hypothetical protein